MEQHTYRHLTSLKDSDYQIVDGEPNIIDWDVKNESNTYIGEVKDLLFDPQTRAVRYIIIDLEDNDMGVTDKKVMIPIGIAHLHTNSDEVVLPNVHADQFNALPSYEDGKIGPDTEVYIRGVIGSPAALRIEEEIASFNQEQFYTHEHFNKDRFYTRGGDLSRTEQQNTIHNMVDNSREHNLHAANEQTGVGTHHNEVEHIKPWLEEGADHNQGSDDVNKTDDTCRDENPKRY